MRDAFDAEVPDGTTYETMGGFVMARLGRVPVVGDDVTVPGWRIHVTGMARPPGRPAALRPRPRFGARRLPAQTPDTVTEVPR